ncbi:MAG: GIY-YIG nuclease family protein [Candidatus Zapsychrus exili]|nr:GIY-YIG nuclease family protein [Candidatus Zapsychrus exili]
MNECWYVYIIECRDKTLYVGVAKDVEKRVGLHNKGLACRFTKYCKPVKLLYVEEALNQNIALSRERQLKGFTRQKKLDLINNKDSAGK